MYDGLARQYPPLGRFRELSQEEREARLETSQELAELIRWIRGDVRLSAWDEQFLAGMAHVLSKYEGRARISRKQWDQLWRIFALATDPAAADDAEDIEGC